jgi:2-polyprenyl-3-methyl-5-hydroxy-6-metoxy-1,4-benzoquinol methylase
VAAMIERACPVCDGRETRPHWRKEDVKLVQCRACGMVFANPIPTALASGEHYEGLASGLYLSGDKLAADYAPVRFERELKVFRRFCPRGKVLDIGCSTGGFLFQLEARWPGGYERLGTDVVGSALDYAKERGVPVVRTGFLEHDFGDRRFDALTMWAVVEHLVEPSKFLAKAAALLRPGGHCFVLVPNLKSLAMRLLGPRYRYVMAEHVNYFSTATLLQWIARVRELQCVALRSTHFNPVVLWQDWRGFGQRVSDAERVALLKRTTAWKQRRGPLRWAYRAVETALGAARLADNLVAVMRRR